MKYETLPNVSALVYCTVCLTYRLYVWYIYCMCIHWYIHYMKHFPMSVLWYINCMRTLSSSLEQTSIYQLYENTTKQP